MACKSVTQPENIMSLTMITLDPAYNKFGYNEHPAMRTNSFYQKMTFLIDINV